MKHGIVLGVCILLLLPLASAAQVTQMSVHAPSISQGEEITLTYTLQHTENLRQVTTDVYLPGGINHKETRQASGKTYKHQQSFRLPRDYQPGDEIRVRVQATNTQPIILTRALQQQPRTTPTTQQPTPQTQAPRGEGVAIHVDPVRDVVPGDAIYYRAQVTNYENQPQTVVLGLSDVSRWATYRVDPAPRQTVRSGETTDFYIYLNADDDAAPGTKYFQVTASVQGETLDAADVRLAVLKPLETQATNYAPWIIALAIILLVLAALILLINYYRPKNKNHDQGGDQDDDFITYY